MIPVSRQAAIAAELVPRPPAWTARAACRGMATRDADWWHPPDELTRAETSRWYRAAQRVCLICPVQVECTRHALVLLEATGDVFGVYGGLSPDQLRALARRLGRPSGKVPQHGTRACYVAGCRCAPCRASNAQGEAERRLHAT